jgi:hypothetical protein
VDGPSREENLEFLERMPLLAALGSPAIGLIALVLSIFVMPANPDEVGRRFLHRVQGVFAGEGEMPANPDEVTLRFILGVALVLVGIAGLGVGGLWFSAVMQGDLE